MRSLIHLTGLALLALATSLGAASAQSRGDLPPVKLPKALAAEWLLQLSPGSGVSPGYQRPDLTGGYGASSGVILSTGGATSVSQSAGIAGGQVVSRRVVDRRMVAGRQVAPRYAPGYAPSGYAPTGYAPAGYAPSGYAPGVRPGYVVQPGYLSDGRPMARPAPQARYGYAAQAPRTPPAPRGLAPQFLPQDVAYSGGEAPGTIVIDPQSKFLYLVGKSGTARRYGVGVGKPGFGWHGSHPISRKAEWPGWTPPAEMIARERKKGRILPDHMEGGEANPLGARALYLGSSLYRIHGTNAPWTIGQNVSSGCIRMRNQDVMELYNRVKVGTKVVVL